VPARSREARACPCVSLSEKGGFEVSVPPLKRRGFPGVNALAGMRATDESEMPRAEGLGSAAPPSIVVVWPEPDFECDMVMRRHCAVFDMAAPLHYLKPADLPQRARRPAHGVPNRVLDALLRGACEA
jgi:hypothetical protein